MATERSRSVERAKSEAAKWRRQGAVRKTAFWEARVRELTVTSRDLFDPSQPRDPLGMWTAEGGETKEEKESKQIEEDEAARIIEKGGGTLAGGVFEIEEDGSARIVFKKNGKNITVRKDAEDETWDDYRRKLTAAAGRRSSKKMLEKS